MPRPGPRGSLRQADLFTETHGEVGIRGWAEFSPCGKYRYLLGREWDPSKPRFLSVGLNPSIADAVRADMTVTKLIGFGRRWEYGSFEIVNPFALIATRPATLLAAAYPLVTPAVGPENDAHIAGAIKRAKTCLIAWGGDAGKPVLKHRVAEVLDRLRALPLFCLGLTADGAPRHPSRAAYSTPLVTFDGGVR
jgi:hypothetical protein